MSNISSGHWANTFTPPVLSSVQALAPTPAPDAAVRAKRSAEPPAATTQTTSWTLPPLTTPSAETTSAADRALQTTLGAVALGSAADKKVQVPANTTIFPLYDAYRRAINAPEVKAFFLTQGVALSTVVVKPDSVTGTFSYYSTSSNKTFTPNDASGWWQASTKLRAAARALDSEGKGLPYAGPGDDSFSRNAILRWYGVTPPTGDGDVTRARQELSATDWSAPTPEKKTELQSRVQTARTAIDALDERAHLASVLTPLIAQKPDEEAVSLSDLQVQVSSTSALVGSEGGTVSIEDALQSHGLALPKTVGELRNAVRWLTASLPPPPPHGNYSGLLADNWSPGVLSAADRADLVTLNDNAVPSESSAFHLLGRLDAGGILGLNNPAVLRHLADHFLDRLLHDDTALLLGDTFANNRRFVGASGTPQLSDQERRQWFIAAIKLQIDPDAPGRPGTVAGYDLYQANNSGRPLAQVREDLEAHLKLNPLLDPRAAPLAAHLFLASAAPEFLVRGIPSTLRMGSSEWADLRLGVALAERLGGAGCSRSMSYQEIIALSRLEPRTTEEAAVMDNYGINILLDWGLMQGLYTKPVDGLYTPQHYQQATQAFATQHEQLVHALKVFKAPLPTRQDLAIANLQKEFPGRSVEQLKAMKVHIADADERRNMKPSEPKTRALLETYMTGDLTQNRWMLLAPGEQPPTPPKHSTPYDSNQDLSKAQQAAVDQNVQALNARIANLPDVQAQLPGAIDAYSGQPQAGLEHHHSTDDCESAFGRSPGVGVGQRRAGCVARASR
ncbi:hypothetical protein LRS56_12210 [Pseudomonas poae]|nr:hypothetical protein LRS56_12210 [Pseudomonas poae]